MNELRGRAGAIRYAGLAVATVTAALIGYVGYVLYPRLDLPAGTGAGLFALSVGAGIASFFSPCSFPLLVSILARSPAAAGGRAERERIAAVARFATALALGASAFLVLLGPESPRAARRSLPT